MKKTIRWMLTAFLAVSFVFSLLSCGGDDSSTGPELPKFGTVCGFVKNKWSYDDIKGAIVTVAGKTDTSVGGSGGFYFEKIPAGTQTLTVTKTGYEAYSASITVKANEEWRREIFLTPILQPGTGAINGQVCIEGTSTGLEGVLVSCEGVSARTDYYGYFLLMNVPIIGRYQTITAAMSGYEDFSGLVWMIAGDVVEAIISMTPSSIHTVEIYATRDTYVSAAAPNHNFDYVNDSRYGICLKPSPDSSYYKEQRIYLYFDLSSLPKNAVIEEATIFAHNSGGAVNNSSSTAVCGALMINKFNFPYLSSTSWSQSGITWNSALNLEIDRVNPGSGWIFTVAGPDEDLLADVTLDIQAYVNGVSGIVQNYNGWVIRSCCDANGGKYNEYKTFVSSDWASGAGPVLTVRYSL